MTIKAWSIGSLLTLDCPACGANTFRAGIFRTSRRCSRCGEDFEPESGFFAGAIYPMYGLGAFLGGTAGLLALFFGASYTVSFFCAAGTLLLLSPWIFWVSRMGFLHTNHRFFQDPS
jgi:uncharacterized protein (DUF983 family)